MKASRLDNDKNIIRCEKTAERKNTFSYDSITEGRQCSRAAIYEINEVRLCKQHAGEYLLINALSG